jgi:hypothetical protein
LFLKSRWERGAYRVGAREGGREGEEERRRRSGGGGELFIRVRRFFILLNNTKKIGLGDLYTVRIFFFF